MARDIPTGIPDIWLPGETIQWYETVDSSQYPTDTYALTYTFTDGTNSFSATGTQYNEQTYLITVASGVTGAMTADTTHGYSAVLSYTASGLSYVHATGTVRTSVNYALSPTTSPLSFYEVSLNAIEAVLENRATEADLSYSIGSGSTARSLSKMSMNELIQARGFFLRKLKAQRRKEKTGSSMKSYRIRG